MKLAGSYAFDAPRSVVWAALFDPEVLAKTLPGCEKLEREGDTFKGDINVKMGPVQGKFQGKVDISDVKELEGYTMVVDGRGPAGFVKANVVADGDATRLDYDSDIQVGGKIASVGQRLLDASSRAIVKQSLEGLHQQIKALAARQAAATASSTPPALSPTGTIGDEPPDDDGWPSSDPPEAAALTSEPAPPAPEAPKPRPAPAPSAASNKPKGSAVAATPSTSRPSCSASPKRSPRSSFRCARCCSSSLPCSSFG
jgi:carbon monoxide dehydrogenase subunit G